MNEKPTGEPRRGEDRRHRPTSPLDAFRYGGRRCRPRRNDQRLGAFFVDRFDTVTLGMVVALLGLTLVDGLLTIELLEINSEEGNPFMHFLLAQGPMAFLLGKYVMTAAGIPFLVVYKNYRMFGSQFRVGYVLPMFLGLYLVLLSYQWVLLLIGPGGPSAAERPAYQISAAPGVAIERRATH
jgi:hypothetical protein